MGKDHPPIERVATLGVDQAGLPQLVWCVPEIEQVGGQASSGSVTDAERGQGGWIVQPTLVEVGDGLGPMELGAVESYGIIQQTGGGMTAQMRDGFWEGEVVIELDQADEIAAASAAVAIEQIFAGVDPEGRPGFGMQRTQPGHLAAGAAPARLPVVTAEIIEQSDAVFQFIQTVAVHASISRMKMDCGKSQVGAQAAMHADGASGDDVAGSPAADAGQRQACSDKRGGGNGSGRGNQRSGERGIAA